MKMYQIVIEETIVDDFTVLADSPEEAQRKGEELYKNGTFVLESGEVQEKRIAVNGIDCENLIDFQKF